MGRPLRIDGRGVPLAFITLLTLMFAGGVTAAVLTDAAPDHTVDDLLALAVVLGLPLGATLLGALVVRSAVLLPAGLALVTLAAAGGGLAVGQYVVNGWPDPCAKAPAVCGPSLDPLSATILGAVLAGAVPALIYLATARSLRTQPSALAFAYLVSLPAFTIWAGLVMLAARLSASSYNIPAD